MTRSKVSKKRTYVRHPGLADAARSLGCSYQHLRQVVVTGKRQSKSLMARYEAFKKDPTMENRIEQFYESSADKPTVRLADWNLGMNAMQWAASLAHLGLMVIAAEVLSAKPTEADFTNPPQAGRPMPWELRGIAKQLGAEMEAANLGHLDSEMAKPGATHLSDEPAHVPTHLFFFYVPDSKLTTALQFVQDALDRRGLLKGAKLGYASASEELWRTFYPGLAGIPKSEQ